MAPLTPPRERGGWWHQYVCPVHGTELAHDGLLSGTFPEGGAACPHGCRLDTPEIRGAWTVLAHQACAMRIRHLAASPAAHDRAQAAEALESYAKLYAELTAEGGLHAEAQDWMLRGRIFHQALTEAIWAVNIGHAVRSLGQPPPGVEPMLATLAEAAEAAREKLIADGKESSNYTAWLNAAAVVCGDTAPDLRGHPTLATHPDGWEWEGSTYYHLFVLRAYLLTLRASGPADLPAAITERLAAMIAVLQGIATPSGELPELHDGPYRREGALTELREVCLLAHQLYAGKPLAQVLTWTEDRTPTPPPDLAGWFTGPALPWPYDTVRRTFPDAGYTVVRAAGIHALLDAGPHGGSHGHQDKLALYLYGEDAAWQPDPGQVPYGHRHFRDYYASTQAHPTFSVDGRDQHKVDAQPPGSCDGAYDGVRATRTLIPTDRYLLDILTLESTDERTLTTHLRPAVRFTATTAPLPRSQPTQPAPHPTATRRRDRHHPIPTHPPTPDGAIRTIWGDQNGSPTLTGLHIASVPAEFTIRPHPGPADDPSRTFQGADWSANTRRATFVSAYHRGGPSHLTALHLTENNVTVELQDGSTHHHPLPGE